MTSYGYTINLQEFEAEALERILRRVIRESREASEEDTQGQVDRVMAYAIIKKIRDCEPELLSQTVLAT
jgi:hypothetical protein